MNRRGVLKGLCVTCLIGGAAFALAGDDKAKPADDKAAAKDTPAKAALERMKKLTGEWIDKDAKVEDAKNPTLTYRVVSAGSAVLETIMPGTDHEMITMYHLDGDTIMLTHYCALGNQPRMRSKGLVGDKLNFECVGGTNMKSENDLHMHLASFVFTDDGHFTSTWATYKDGKPAEHKATFSLVRKK